MTEDEAKTKWCHQRPRTPSVRSDDQSAMGIDSICLGSACMAWRWNEQDYDYAVTKGEPVHGSNAIRIPQPDAQEGWERVPAMTVDFMRVPWRRRVPNQHGHCGLAGKP